MEQRETDKGITFYDILVSKNNKLVLYVRKEGVIGKLEKIDYTSEFPIYGSDLERQFKTGRDRVNALRVGEIVIRHFGDLRNRNQDLDEVNLKVAEYLNNECIKYLRKAAIRAMDKKYLNR